MSDLDEYTLTVPAPSRERQAAMEYTWATIAKEHGALSTYILVNPKNGQWSFTATFPSQSQRTIEFAKFWMAHGWPAPIVSKIETPS